MSGNAPDADVIRELRRELAAAQSEIRLLKRRLGDVENRAGSDGALRDRLRDAVPQRKSAAPSQAAMKLGRRLDFLSSPILVGFVAVLAVAIAVDAGIGWYQAHSLKAERQARLQLENLAMRSLYLELRSVAYATDGKSYRMTISLQNNSPDGPLYVMLNPVGVYVQVGMSWQQVPSRPLDGTSWGVVKVDRDFSYDVLFTPEVTGWAELIPGYMHVRIQDDVLVSQKAQPGNDVVERRTPFYVYLKPHGEDVRTRGKPLFMPMPPH